jgi:hypothetical protein
MDDSKEVKVFRAHRKLVNKSLSETKGCYFIGCEKPTIRAHSISNKRLLLKLSRDGYVMYLNRNTSDWGSLVETGRGVATTFSGFCSNHDKIFHPIDNKDYVVGNVEQEYLFAFRAAAKEFTTRKAMVHATDTQLVNNQEQEFPLDDFGLAMMDNFKQGFTMGLEDQKTTRGVFIDTFDTGKYNVLETAVLEIGEELPIAVSSTFNLELAYDGNLINDVSPAGYGTQMKPCFLTIFPQNGKTYGLISYFRKDKSSYGFLKNLDSIDDSEKKVILSNLLTSYTENFVAEPAYWESLSNETKKKYSEICANYLKVECIPFVADDTFSLFPSDQ